MVAEIITIGDELLIGQVVDTNSAWIAENLSLIGISVRRITSVSDKKEEIIAALDESGQRVDLILITGGLGPTNDDISKKTLCEYFNSKLIVNEIVSEDIRNFLAKHNVFNNNANKSQAEVPDKCTVIRNFSGTAPGMWFTSGDKTFISLPGVPYEMKAMMENEILQKLKMNFPVRHIFYKTIYTQGIAESILSEVLTKWEENLSKRGIRLAYLPQPGIIRLRLTAEGDDIENLMVSLDEEIIKLSEIIPEYIFSYDEESLEEIIGRLLKQEKKTLSVAESCTGGNLSGMIVSVPGCSEYFKGSVVAYSNDIKINILKVMESTLLVHGAVSKEVVEEMAKSVLKIFKTDYSIATSGIAGPSGDTDAKKVGSVWISVASDEEISTAFYNFGDDRKRNITRASITALNMLRKLILRSGKN